MRRTAVAAMVAALILGGVAGCGGSTDDDARGGPTFVGAPAASGSQVPTGSAAVTADPRTSLRAAARRLGEQPLRMSMDAGALMTSSGKLDPQARRLDMRMEVKAGGSMTMRMVGIGDELYLKYSGTAAASLGDGWLHVDSAKLPAGSSLKMMPEGDPAGANKLIAGIAEVRSTGPGRFAGTLDATRSTTMNTKTIEAFGAKAKKVPFTAQVDAKGRLVGIDVDMSVLSPMMPKMVTRYSDFGTPVTVQKPAGAREMPADVVRLMG